MSEKVQQIKTTEVINPLIYAYITPENKTNDGWVKIGYTERESEKRIKEQTHTAGVKAVELWNHTARFADNDESKEPVYFKDTDFHSYLTHHNIERRPSTEWFKFAEDAMESEKMFMAFTYRKKYQGRQSQGTQYQLRKEQEEAVNKAYEYFQSHKDGEFLWNAKPRFGKTLSAYDLVRRMKADSVLIVTNRPAIANSWYDDFAKFIEWQTGYLFVSESESLSDRPTFSREEFNEELERQNYDDNIGQIVFLSLQDLKGSIYHGGTFRKLEWVGQINWDLLIIDEAHEGIDTLRTDVAFDSIKRQNTLHLSGTPFKQLAQGKFGEDQVYNWSYVDEQEAKEAWDKDSFNPYSNLPKLNMFTYQMSNMIRDQITGAQLEEEDNIDYAFDLNEFFATNESGNFIYEADVIRWLDSLTQNEKYPFSTPQLRKELAHTFWFLDRVDSAKALKKILNRHPVFENYEVIMAAGQDNHEMFDGEVNKKALDRVHHTIKHSGKRTITLSVGQLTTGVTVPEWTAVLMLNNVKSASLYMQAAFRAQNPHSWTAKDARGQEVMYQKKNAYIFDFAPERTLQLVDEFANELNPSTSRGYGTTEEREENIRTLLNFFLVIGEDSQGRMVELDARQVMTIPKFIKANEVVKRGFMSNLLFANISRIFQAPRAVMNVIQGFDKTEEGKKKNQSSVPDPQELENIDVDEQGDLMIDEGIVINKAEKIFGKKQYDFETIAKPEVVEQASKLPEDKTKSFAKELGKNVIQSFKENGYMDKLKEEFNLTARKLNQREKEMEDKVVQAVNRFDTEISIQKAREEDKFNKQMAEAKDDQERKQFENDYQQHQETFTAEYKDNLMKTINKTVAKYQHDVVEQSEREMKEKEKLSIEEDIRSHLRGFARTIPSFIMAYGDRNLTLTNFDTYTPAGVFKDVTGITLEEFRFLRDGGDYIDEEDGQSKYFKGQLFDEIVFNQSVQEFLNKREELADYFEDNQEDIFEYIPNQQTNQIFTPKWVVQMMVKQLEEENPGIYDDSSKTFIDLYMKSGLYITEIVKRLYNSHVIKEEFPNDQDRLKHILENQVYGLAPTEIIYRIAVRFIFGNYGDSISQKNFKCLDAYPYAENGTLEQKLDEVFGSEQEE
ncbi:type II restriction enzyme [Ignavigranum ruoffiae]|uniref:Type II restriction enzyme n=1 Tax=Ignavigranum ruoffiae TaxID=89093 RepID=A0A1H9FUK9_9LACT|nr:DEAD/DEAH box helicase family protein [Ignavigranum ruoffiae]SEQ41557.1 type II restriction enzyme [Ignavigranum ruoffiae]